MASHELVLVDAMQNHVHDGPLRRDLSPTAIGLRFRQRDRCGAAQINLEAVLLDVNAAPDHFAWFAYALQSAAAEAEVHGRLALADGSLVAANEMRGGNRAGDLEEPYELIKSVGGVSLAPADIVQSCGRIEPHRRPDAICDHRIDADALVNLIEMRQRPACIKLTAISTVGRRTIDVVEQSLDEIGGGRQVFEPLLVLDADGVASELIGNAQHGDVH